MRVALDPNVLLSTLVFQSSLLSPLRYHWREGNIIPIASAETLKELVAVLAYPKFSLSVAAIEALLSDFLPWCETFAVPQSLPVPDCRDPNDLPFLKLALAARADALVTGDADLLVLEQGFPIPIITPQALLSRLPSID